MPYSYRIVNHYYDRSAHLETSKAMEAFRRGMVAEFAQALRNLIQIVEAWAKFHGVDLDAVIRAKSAYNRQRADHKAENRAKQGGKLF
jgi:hypothetical protein